MKMIRNLCLAAVALAFVVTSILPAQASSVWLCIPVTNSAGSKRVVNPNTTNAYVTNGRGCALIGSADIGYFQSLGYAQVGTFQAIVALAQTTSFSMILPAGTFIQDIISQETSGAAITGGIKIGSTSGGSDVLAGMTVSASTLNMATDVSMSKRVFSATAPQTLFIGTVQNSFNSAALNLTIIYGYF
jgi:hypothetical protein